MIVVISNPVFGKNMRFLRRKYGLSRKSLAMLLGVDPKLIRRAEAPVWSYQGIDFPHKPLMRPEKLFRIDINQMLCEDMKG